MRNQKGFTLVDLMVILSIGGIFLSVGLSVGVKAISDYSEGQRTGELVKFSKKGAFYKTWEGQLKLGEATTNFWDFSIDAGAGHGEDTEALIATLNESLGDNLKVRYVERIYWPWRADSSYIIQSIEVIENENP